MRVSQFLTKTLREVPSDAETISHQLMLRAGMIQQLAAGIYSYLPLALRSLRKIETIIREEMDNVGAIEVRMPVLQPIEIWEETGRIDTVGPILFKLEDRRNRSLVLGPTHEEVVTSIAKSFTSSYRDLPRTIYQIQTKFRDEPRPRAGLLRGREFDMKDAYSFDADQEGLDVSYDRMVQAYGNIFKRCGLPTIKVEADSGAIGGKDSHEFIMPAENGEDVVIICSECNYAANVEKAESLPQEFISKELNSIQKIATPEQSTIAQVSSFFATSASQTIKSLIYKVDDALLLVAIRGDLEINEVKLANYLKSSNLRLATSDELEKAALVSGYISPVELGIDIRQIGDHSLVKSSNLIAGANSEGYHFTGINYERDFSLNEITDLAQAAEGHGCPLCKSPLKSVRGIEVGHVFKLGSFYSESLKATYLDQKGEQKPLVMGCYGIGVTRILAAAIEQNHDSSGIIFPPPISPYNVHLVALNTDDQNVLDQSEILYTSLISNGIETLFDDRKESPGVKLKDADLLGIPTRVVISKRTLQSNSVEISNRGKQEPRILELDQALEILRNP